MKGPRWLIPVAVLLIGVGCESQPASVSNSSQASGMSQVPAQGSSSVAKTTVITNQANPNVHYRVEVIPNTRLSPTSREGDKSARVYSSNIIAVHVETNGASAVAPPPEGGK